MRGKWWTLVGACFGLFLLMLDSTVVSLALPRIRGDVGASAEQLQWMMNVYLLTIAVLAVTAGRLGDMFGRRRLFLLGMLVFGIGSVVSGLANDPDVLILGRILQGVGAAPMLTLSLALVCNVFPEAEVPKALGIWAGVSASALAIGPLVGGALVELDWRVIFLVNLPLVALGDPDRRPRRARVDRPAGDREHRLAGPRRRSASASPWSSWRWSSRKPGRARW